MKCIEPSFVALTGRRSELDSTAWRYNYQTLLMESRRIRIVIRNLMHCLNGHTFRFQLRSPRGSGILLTPIQGPRVRVDPEEATMAILRHAFTAGPSRIFPKELAYHGLSDSRDHAWVGPWIQASLAEGWASWYVEPMIDVGPKRRD